MKIQKQLGIWMDHSTAYLIDLHSKKIKHSILSKFTSSTKEGALHRSESLMHNKEQQMHDAYHKKIADQVLKYDNVLLFGPTKAKSEFRNYLSEDLHFKDIKLEIESADKMTDNERVAYVKNHFENKDY